MSPSSPAITAAARTIAATAGALSPRRGGPVVVALDGPSGAGKSTVARLVAEELGAAVVPADDFFSAQVTRAEWDARSARERAGDALDWRRLRREVLEPLRAGRTARWHALDFEAGERADGTWGLRAQPSERPAAPVVVLEGAYAARPELADLIDLSVLVDAPAPVRQQRLARRERASVLSRWRARWDAAEELYFRQVRPPSSFDLVVSTDPVPAAHRAFLEAALPVLRADPRLVGVAAGGSYLTETMDEHSDLDLVIAVEPPQVAAVMAERSRIAAALGPLLAAFTGEHVGEPRLLICLYDQPLLHVDLKFVSLDDVAERVEDPAVLWERDGRLAAALTGGRALYPAPDPQWIEDRFWIWVHYAATKIARGELFEALGFLAFLRGSVLGPLALARAGARPSGVRKIEQLAPDVVPGLRQTVAAHDAADCRRALRASVDLYRALRPVPGGGAAERAAVEFLDAIATT
jgi:uridine kinase